MKRGIADLSGKNAQLGRLTLAARVGIEIGPVVVDASGQIFGDAPNIDDMRLPHYVETPSLRKS